MNKQGIIELIDALLAKQITTDGHLYENTTAFVHDSRSVMSNVYGLSSPELDEFNREIKSVEGDRPHATSVLNRKLSISRGALVSAKTQLTRDTVRQVDPRVKAQKIIQRLKDDNWWVQQNDEGEDIHLMVGNRNDDGQKAHIVIDGKTGMIRFEENQKFPEDILEEFEATLTFPGGKRVRTSRKSIGWDIASVDSPNIIVSRLIRDDHIMLEMRNEGTSGLHEMKCTIKWSQQGQPQERELYQFFSPGQDVRLTSSSRVETIGAQGQYIITGLPQWADNREIIVEVSGKSIKKGDDYHTESRIEVGTPPVAR